MDLRAVFIKNLFKENFIKKPELIIFFYHDKRWFVRKFTSIENAGILRIFLSYRQEKKIHLARCYDAP